MLSIHSQEFSFCPALSNHGLESLQFAEQWKYGISLLEFQFQVDLRKIKILLAQNRNQNHHFVSSKIFLDEESASFSSSAAFLEYSEVRKGHPGVVSLKIKSPEIFFKMS